MYTASKATNGVFGKHRPSGKILALDVSKAVKSVSPPNEKSFPDSLRMSPCAERLPIGPNPVFQNLRNGSNSNRRKPRHDKTPEEEVRRVKPDAEVVSFFAVSWNSLQTTPEAEKKNNAPKSNDIVYYRPRNTVKVPDFTPCNYERVWADHHYQRLMRHINLTLQNQTP